MPRPSASRGKPCSTFQSTQTLPRQGLITGYHGLKLVVCQHSENGRPIYSGTIPHNPQPGNHRVIIGCRTFHEFLMYPSLGSGRKFDRLLINSRSQLQPREQTPDTKRPTTNATSHPSQFPPPRPPLLRLPAGAYNIRGDRRNPPKSQPTPESQIHIPSTILLDLQATYPQHLIPKPLRDASEWYIAFSGDPLINGVFHGGPDFNWFRAFLYLEAYAKHTHRVIGTTRRVH